MTTEASIRKHQVSPTPDFHEEGLFLGMLLVCFWPFTASWEEGWFFWLANLRWLNWLNSAFPLLERGSAQGEHCGSLLFQDQNLPLLLLFRAHWQARSRCCTLGLHGRPHLVRACLWPGEKACLVLELQRNEATWLTDLTFYHPGWPLSLIIVMFGLSKADFTKVCFISQFVQKHAWEGGCWVSWWPPWRALL